MVSSRVSWLVVATIAPAAPAVAACPRLATERELLALAESAEQAYGRIDAEVFLPAASSLLDLAPCAEFALSPPLAARTHRVAGLLAFVLKDSDRARAAFASARRIEPEMGLPHWLVRPGEPEIELFVSAQPAGGTVLVVPPDVGAFAFDGATGIQRPASAPTVWQHIGADGRTWDGVYLLGEDAIPYVYVRPEAPAAAPAPMQSAAPPVLPKPEPKRGPPIPIAFSVTSLVVGGALVGAGAASYLGHCENMTDFGERYCDATGPSGASYWNSHVVWKYAAGGGLLGLGGVGLGVSVLLTGDTARVEVGGRW